MQEKFQRGDLVEIDWLKVRLRNNRTWPFDRATWPPHRIVYATPQFGATYMVEDSRGRRDVVYGEALSAQKSRIHVPLEPAAPCPPPKEVREAVEFEERQRRYR